MHTVIPHVPPVLVTDAEIRHLMDEIAYEQAMIDAAARKEIADTWDLVRLMERLNLQTAEELRISKELLAG